MPNTKNVSEQSQVKMNIDAVATMFTTQKKNILKFPGERGAIVVTKPQGGSISITLSFYVHHLLLSR